LAIVDIEVFLVCAEPGLAVEVDAEGAADSCSLLLGVEVWEDEG
jgi:hypothetical protein